MYFIFRDPEAPGRSLDHSSGSYRVPDPKSIHNPTDMLPQRQAILRDFPHSNYCDLFTLTCDKLQCFIELHYSKLLWFIELIRW